MAVTLGRSWRKQQDSDGAREPEPRTGPRFFPGLPPIPGRTEDGSVTPGGCRSCWDSWRRIPHLLPGQHLCAELTKPGSWAPQDIGGIRSCLSGAAVEKLAQRSDSRDQRTCQPQIEMAFNSLWIFSLQYCNMSRLRLPSGFSWLNWGH